MRKNKKRENKMGKKIMTILVVGILVSTLFPLSPIVSGVGGSTAIAESPIELTYDFDSPSEQKIDRGGNMYDLVSLPTSSPGKGNQVGSVWSLPVVQQSKIGSKWNANGASNPKGLKVFSPKTNRWTTSPVESSVPMVKPTPSESMTFPMASLETELAYDDGEANGYTYWHPAGNKYAVRFTSPSYPANLMTARIRFRPEMPDSNHEQFAVKVYDDNGAGGKPGTLLGGPVYYTAPDWGWNDVDISGLGITITSGDFYIAYRQLTFYPNCEALSFDDDQPQYGRSWACYDGSWNLRPDVNYMIRCIVDLGTIQLDCTCGDICVNTTGWWHDGGLFNASDTPIQHSVDNATVGDTICIKDGTYNENINVDARLTIRSENGSASTIVQAASPNDHVFDVTASYVNISGFTAQNANADYYAGIRLCDVVHCNISGNAAANNNYGIYLSKASNNNITCNWVHGNTQRGFNLTGGSIGNNISHNNIIANGVPQTNGSYQWQFYNNQTDNIDAMHNWWGTDNETKINASIYDWNNDNTKGIVTFLPKLDKEDPCAPIPELPTLILVGVGLVVIAGYRRTRRKS